LGFRLMWHIIFENLSFLKYKSSVSSVIL